MWAGSSSPVSVMASQCMDSSPVRGLVLSLCKIEGLVKGVLIRLALGLSGPVL